MQLTSIAALQVVDARECAEVALKMCTITSSSATAQHAMQCFVAAAGPEFLRGSTLFVAEKWLKHGVLTKQLQAVDLTSAGNSVAFAKFTVSLLPL